MEYQESYGEYETNDQNVYENAIFNRTLPIRFGIVFQPVTNQETERINNVLKVGAVFSINISDITGNNVEIYTQYEICVNLTLTTMAT